MSGASPRARLALLAALATLAAAACGDSHKTTVAPSNALADSSDQVMYGASHILTDQGLLRARLHADTAYFFDQNSRIEMRVVQVTFFTTNGAKNAVLTSRAGTFNQRLQTMQARGDVVVVSEDGRRLTTQQLKYDQRANQISSDSAFVLTEPGRELRGVGFVSDPNMTNIRCLAACGGSAGVIDIPAGENPAGAPAPSTAPAPSADSAGKPAPVRPGDRPGSIRLPEEE